MFKIISITPLAENSLWSMAKNAEIGGSDVGHQNETIKKSLYASNSNKKRVILTLTLKKPLPNQGKYLIKCQSFKILI